MMRTNFKYDQLKKPFPCMGKDFYQNDINLYFPPKYPTITATIPSTTLPRV